MDRNEHLAECKRRALEYLDAGDLNSAGASMLSDLNKHPETRLPDTSPLIGVIFLYLANEDAAAVRRWIEGFR
jgi:hypothetical protein